LDRRYASTVSLKFSSLFPPDTPWIKCEELENLLAEFFHHGGLDNLLVYCQPAFLYRSLGSVSNANRFSVFICTLKFCSLLDKVLISVFYCQRTCSSRLSIEMYSPCYSEAYLQSTVRVNRIYLHRCQFLYWGCFLVPVSIFPCDGFCKKEVLFYSHLLNQWKRNLCRNYLNFGEFFGG